MKKTIIALISVGNIALAATDVIYWGGDGGYDLLTINNGSTPYLTTNKSSWGSQDIVTSITTADNTDYNLIFNPSENKEGNPPAPVTTPVFVLNQAIYLNKVNIDGTPTPTSISINFGTNGSITTDQEINFGQTIDIILKATLTDTQITSLQQENTVVSRTLLYAGGNWGVWNFDKAKSVTLEIAGIQGFEYIGKITTEDELKSGQYGYISTTVEGTNAPGAVIMVVKSIPEPTTATLNLLALAGLAARRRR